MHPVTIAGHIDVDWADIGDHSLGPRAVPRVATITTLDGVLRVADVAIHLTFQPCLEHAFGQITQLQAEVGDETAERLRSARRRGPQWTRQ